MKAQLLISWCILGLVAPAGSGAPAGAQATMKSRLYNPYSVRFQPTWNVVLPDKVKLIDVTSFSADRASLVMIVADAKDDPRRTLLITHWDGYRFSTDYSVPFLGTPMDTLLAGHFRDPKPVVGPDTAPPVSTGHKAKAAPPPRWRQVITTDGVYETKGTSFARVFEAPSNVRLDLVLDKIPEQLVSGTGNNAFFAEVGDVDVHPTSFDPPRSGGGYARSCVGVQDPPDASCDFHPGVTFLQSYFNGRDKWVIGLQRGKSAPTTDDTSATTGDHIVVYTPNFASRDKSFWAMRSDDFDESWRSAPLSGRVLDVRVGDPQNSGAAGIVVLTAENDDKLRRLSFLQPFYPMPGAM